MSIYLKQRLTFLLNLFFLFVIEIDRLGSFYIQDVSFPLNCALTWAVVFEDSTDNHFLGDNYVEARVTIPARDRIARSDRYLLSGDCSCPGGALMLEWCTISLHHEHISTTLLPDKTTTAQQHTTMQNTKNTYSRKRKA